MLWKDVYDLLLSKIKLNGYRVLDLEDEKVLKNCVNIFDIIEWLI